MTRTKATAMAAAMLAATLAIGTAASSQSNKLAERFLAKAGKPAAERGGERVVSGDALVPVTVNGKPLRLKIEPGVPGLPLIAPALAPDLGLKGGGILAFGVGYSVGREAVHGRTQGARFGWTGSKPDKRRVGWISRAYQPPADGTIGPAGLPESVIRFALHPARVAEQTVTLPMHGGSGLFGSWFAIEGMAAIGGSPMFIRFDPYHPRSLANASAAIALAASHAGAMTAEAGRQEIAFGIERPYRVMKLGRPLAIGGLSLASLGVRVTDGNIAGRIAEEGAPPEKVDPDEVVVTARKGKPPVNLLILGADALAGCSSIVFDKPARTIRLSCGG